ncbi:MAG: SGNH/GDSL hydrolase family protein [Nostocaceae cyanobacterium]|nr:SGNH/GDSL hydrolase family protein [Nostocaceae cyanobacterium]
MKKAFLAAGFTFLSLMMPLEAKATTFSKMYLFGDSLSDPGNIFNVTTAANQANELFPGLISEDAIIPPIDPPVPPYDESGRISNGLIWADYLAEDLGLNLTPSTTLSLFSPVNPTPSPITIFDGQPVVSPFFNGSTTNNGVNFAFGAAQTGLRGSTEFGELVPGVLTQISWFTNDLNLVGQQADSEALYTIWVGPNDYWDQPDANPIVSVNNIKTGIQSLYNIGSRNFLIPNLPDLGRTPRGLISNEESQRLSNLTNTHNSLLDTTIQDLRLELNDINLVSFDVFSLFNDTLENPEIFGFENVTTPCILDISCDPDKYLFWDDRHPTTIAHQTLAKFALAELEAEHKSVPEPSSILGLALSALAIGSTVKQKEDIANP